MSNKIIYKKVPHRWEIEMRFGNIGYLSPASLIGEGQTAKSSLFIVSKTNLKAMLLALLKSKRKVAYGGKLEIITIIAIFALLG